MTGKNWASTVLTGEPPLDPPEPCETCDLVDCECVTRDDWMAEDILADYDDDWADA